MRANYGASFALRLVTLLISAFLVFCAVCSLVVLKRSESQSKSSLQGITRLLIISSVLFASICTEFVIFCIEFGVASGFSVLFYVPEWLDYGISKLFLHIIETCCLFLMCWLACKKFVRPDEPKSELRDHLLNAGSRSDDDNVPLAYQI